MSDSAVAKWSPGSFYGPVLSQTDLYLLNTELEINPILADKHKSFHLVFNLITGQTGGFNSAAGDRDLPFTAKDEPATLPRVSQLIIISDMSPWCTIVKNDQGVTMHDVCTTIWKDYTENLVTDAEFAALPPRYQDQVKRIAAHNASQQSAWGGVYYSPQPPNRYRRVDWLRERIYFQILQRMDAYAMQRLGFKAPNIFVMTLGA